MELPYNYKSKVKGMTNSELREEYNRVEYAVMVYATNKFDEIRGMNKIKVVRAEANSRGITTF